MTYTPSGDEMLTALIQMAKQDDAFVTELVTTALIDGTNLHHKSEWDLEDNCANTEWFASLTGKWLDDNNVSVDARINIIIENIGLGHEDLCEVHGWYEGLDTTADCPACQDEIA